MPAPVTACAFSPFLNECFVIGCADGVRLYRTTCTAPLLTWDTPAAVYEVRWSLTHSLSKEFKMSTAAPSFCVVAVPSKLPVVAITVAGTTAIRSLAPALCRALPDEEKVLSSLIDSALS